jgi:hypothetical protein
VPQYDQACEVFVWLVEMNQSPGRNSRSDDNYDDNCCPNDASDTATYGLSCLVTTFAYSWQCGGAEPRLTDHPRRSLRSPGSGRRRKPVQRPAQAGHGVLDRAG